MGHARALVGVKEDKVRKELAQQILESGVERPPARASDSRAGADEAGKNEGQGEKA